MPSSSKMSSIIKLAPLSQTAVVFSSFEFYLIAPSPAGRDLNTARAFSLPTFLSDIKDPLFFSLPDILGLAFVPSSRPP